MHEQRPVERELLERMNEIQFHRGPDEGGVHVEPGVGLAHRRLSIIDLADGHQPMHSEDGSLVVVYNGEIYNFPRLREQLKEAGHRFRSRCDTEVILYAWKEWGERCVERFRGMFAFALWDRSRQALFMARDRLGIKPLHYTFTRDGRVVFGSELKALLAVPSLTRALDPRAIEDYFTFGYVPDPATIFEGIYKLPPGHTLTLVRGGARPEPKRYWDVTFRDEGDRDRDAIQNELIDRLRESVKIRLVADVPLGAFLSGGVDSSAIVAMMAGLGGDPVNTCSISFGDRAFDEAYYAAMVAERYRTNHSVERVEADDFDLIDRLAGLYDEPYADSSALPTYRVCELARKHVTVALSGDGGDEGFAGYRRYRWHMHEEKVRRRLPATVRRGLFGLLGRLYPRLDWAPRILRAKATFQAIARDSLDGYLDSVSIMPDTMRMRLYSKSLLNQLGGYRAIEVFQKYMDRAPDHPLSLVQYLDFKTYLPGDILAKVDRASMAHGLEVRVPVLDHEFIEWVCGLSPEEKLHGGEGKYIFKGALEAYLPHEILYRRKMGFAVPISSWFRGPLRRRLRDSLLGESLRSTGLFDMGFVTQLVDQHQSGMRDHSAPLWSLLMFESFYRQVIRGV